MDSRPEPEKNPCKEWNLLDLQFFEFVDDILTVARGLYLPIDIHDLSILSDIEGPSFRKLPPFMDYSISPGHFLIWITQDWIIGLQ
jgi:hypothetical protein